MDTVRHNDNDVVSSTHLDSAARLICKDIIDGKFSHIPLYSEREIPSMILTELEMELRVGLCRIKEEFSECAFGHSPVRHLSPSKQDSAQIPAYLKHEGFSSSIPRWAFARFIKNIPSCLEESSWLASSSSSSTEQRATASGSSSTTPMSMSFQPNVLAISTWNRSEEVIVHDVDMVGASLDDGTILSTQDTAVGGGGRGGRRNKFVKTRVQVDSGECFWMINPLFAESHLSMALQSIKHYLDAIPASTRKSHQKHGLSNNPQKIPQQQQLHPIECKVMSAEVAPEAWSFSRLRKERIHRSSIPLDVEETDVQSSKVVWTNIRNDSNNDDDVLVSAMVDDSSSCGEGGDSEDDELDDYDFVRYAYAKLTPSPPSIAIRKTGIREFVVGATNTDSPDIKLSVCNEICVDRNVPHSFHMTRSPTERVKILSSSNLTTAPVVADLSDDFNDTVEMINRQASANASSSSSMDVDSGNGVQPSPAVVVTATKTSSIPPISRLKCRRSVLIGGGASSVVGRTISYDVIREERLHVRPIWRIDVTMVWQSPDHMLCRRRYESFMTSNGGDDPLGAAEHEPIYEVEIECVDPVFWASRIAAELQQQQQQQQQQQHQQQGQNSVTLENAFSLLLGEMVVMANNMWGLSLSSLGNESSAANRQQQSQKKSYSSLMESLMTSDPQQPKRFPADEESDDSFHPQSPVYIPHYDSAYYNNGNGISHISGSLTSPPQSPKHGVSEVEEEPWYGTNLQSLLLPIAPPQQSTLPNSISNDSCAKLRETSYQFEGGSPLAPQAKTPLYVERRFAR